MTEISEDNKVFRLINVFTVESQNQVRLVKILEKPTSQFKSMSSSFATRFISSVAIPLLALLIWVTIYFNGCVFRKDK